MLTPLKDAAKRLPYPFFLRVFLAWHRLVEVRRCRAVQRKMGFRPLAAADMAAVKTSDTFFILGGGSSINRISAERWQAIAAHDTVGFNFWLFHPFVPRMYFFEAMTSADHPRMFEEFARISRARSADYRDTLKVITEPQHADRAGFAYPPEWTPELHSICTVPVAARNDAEFAYGVRYLRSKGIFRPESPHLFKQLSTLSSLLALAVKMGYRTVVLCGVDLRDSRYFYQDPDLYPETKDLEFLPPAATQVTLAEMPWRVTIDRVVLELKKQVLDPAGIRLFVENRSSALWPDIPEAPEDVYKMRSTPAGTAPR